jgi:predicted glycosyltransferase
VNPSGEHKIATVALYVHELAAMRNVMRVTTIQRSLAADLLQIQRLGIMMTSISSIDSGPAREPLAAPMAAE